MSDAAAVKNATSGCESRVRRFAVGTEIVVRAEEEGASAESSDAPLAATVRVSSSTRAEPRVLTDCSGRENHPSLPFAAVTLSGLMNEVRMCGDSSRVCSGGTLLLSRSAPSASGANFVLSM